MVKNNPSVPSDRSDRIGQSQSDVSNHSNVEVLGPIYSRKEVCKILGISLRTEHNYRLQKKISYSQNNRKIFYRPSDINEFLDRNHFNVNDFQKGGSYDN